ncbi:MAG: hypothetical protein R2864_08180 [Syntrophotaleaceae bacterium]
MKKLALILSAALVLAAFVLPLSAMATTFTDRSAWEAAVVDFADVDLSVSLPTMPSPPAPPSPCPVLQAASLLAVTCQPPGRVRLVHLVRRQDPHGSLFQRC